MGKKRVKLEAGCEGRFVPGERVVDDPYEAGAKMRARVNLAEHPLEHMAARRRLSPAQYEAGVRFRAIYERGVIGPGRGIDPGKIQVDGGRLGDPLSDDVVAAHRELKRLSALLGKNGEAVLVAVAGRGETVAELSKRWPGDEAARKKMDYLTMRFREVLEFLATEVWGARGPERGRIVADRGDSARPAA